MLSILIPTYDYTCYPLVADLHEQAEKLSVPYEIIVAEDGSHSQVDIIANHKMEKLSHCQHLINQEHVGPAGIRNLLARKASYNWILFIDSDAKVMHKEFLQTYLNQIGKADVIVGGLRHQKENHDPNKSLRFKYEKEADKHRSAVERSLHPYNKFTPFNVMLRRSTFLCIGFDESCHEYGYEDALFGVELKKRNISILHIENPLLHMGLDNNEVFLKKTETALRTLKKLNGKMERYSYVGRVYRKCCKYHMGWALRSAHTMLWKVLRCQLCSKNPSLFLFSIYKLLYYSTL